MRRLLICVAIAGCARAGQENTIVGGLTDAGSRGDDALAADAPPPQTTLTQTTSNAVAAGNSFCCPQAANSYYRVFALSEYGITTTLHVTQVEFGIEEATAGQSAANQPATLHIGTYSGPRDGTTLDLSQVRMISSVDLKIPNGRATAMTVPITADVAPTASMIVELAIPDPGTGGDAFFVGTTTDVESHPGYIREPVCNHPNPTSMQSIADVRGFGTVHLVLTVTGTTGAPD
jgi:hypothetical protein